MTSVTQRAVCEHSLLVMQNVPYGLFSMQHGSFVFFFFFLISDNRNVISFQILKPVFCIINKLCSHKIVDSHLI